MKTNVSIKNKLGNLINISLKDTSIFTNVNATHIDLSKYVDSESVDKFFDGSINRIEINVNIDENKIKKLLRDTKDENEFIDTITEYRIHVPETKLKLLREDFKAYKDMCLEIAIDFISNIKQNISYVEKKAREIKNDKGSWNLYFTRYFLTGKTPNKRAAIKAPILFYNVELSVLKEQSKIVITKVEDSLTLNEKLVIYLLRDVNKENKLLSEFNNIKSVDDFKEKVENIIGLNLYTGRKTDLSFLNKKTKEIASSYENQLVIEDGLTFGIYEPIGGKLKQDLESLINQNDLDGIFDNPQYISNETIEAKELDDEPLVQIGKLDLYQKFAVRSSLLQNTIIHGPPGTGKSEVITNIIANAILDNKSIMMVSEKKAALDVLEKRLKSLKIFLLQIYDNNDKESFYSSISNLDKFIGKSWINSNAYHSVSSYKDDEIYLHNKSKQNRFVSRVKTLLEFENFKHLGYDYNDFHFQIDKIWKDKNLFFNIMNDDVIGQLNQYIDYSNKTPETFFDYLDSFSKFILSNHLSSTELFGDFKREVDNFLRYKNEFNFNINDIDKIIQIKKFSEFLTKFLSDNLLYEQTLRNDPYSFYTVVKVINDAKNNLSGIIHPNFFENMPNLFNKVKAFFNLINTCKKSKVKYFLDQFVYNNNFVNEKPFSKLFYKTKLDKKDMMVLNNLEKINNLKCVFTNDIDYVMKHWYYFEPIVVMYYFNKKIFDSRYINFINNKYYLLSYQMFELQTMYKFTYEKYKITNDLIATFNIFKEKFPEIDHYQLINDYIDEFNKIEWSTFDNVIATYVKQYLLNKLSKLNFDQKKMLEKAIHVSNLKRKPGIYKYVEEYKEVLLYLFPIWVSRPEQISLYTNLEHGIFDYGIFDEASQMFLERAYPLLFRNKINIVAGDEHQLKPSSFFTSRSEEENEDELEVDDLDTQESLLDRAQVTSWNNVMLKNHYRSEKKELIQFSNRFVYGNRLQYASINSMNNINGLEVINVDGLFNNKYNQEEADKTLELLAANVNKYESILVITANASQSNYLSKLIFSPNFKNKVVTSKYIDGKIEIINIENVQGNEADLVILSICYGKKDKDAKVYSRFGPLINDGGKNRLNVAITRGKKKMIVIKSLYASDINVSTSKNINLITFRNYIEFLDNNEKVKAEMLKEKNKTRNHYIFDYEFEREVFNEIKRNVEKANYVIDTKYEVGSKNIDIVVINPEEQKVVLGIEIDGWKYHKNPLDMVEDIYRQQFIESRGYPIFRVLEFEWKYNKSQVLEELYKILNIKYQ